MSIRIVQLYPAELGVTGDRGNVDVLRTRAAAAGLPVEIAAFGVGEELVGDADVLILGNGPLSALRRVHEDVQGRRARIAELAESGTGILAVGAGAELVGREIALLDGERLEGLGVLDFWVARTRERRVGYVIADTPDGELVGFEDHASEWTLGSSELAYGSVTHGRGSFTAAGSRGETVRAGGIVATNVQGPVLPLNPWLADSLLVRAAQRRGLVYATGARHRELDVLADGARAATKQHTQDAAFTYMRV